MQPPSDEPPVLDETHPPAARGPVLPWTQRRPVLGKPPEWPSGFVDEGQLHPAPVEAMVERARHGQPLPLVWTPETPGMVWPEEVPQLFAELRRGAVAAARDRLKVPGAALVVLAGLTVAGLVSGGGVGTFPVLLGVAFVFVAVRALVLRDALRLTPAAFRREVEDAVHAAWAERQPMPWTRVLVGCIAVVGAAQVISPGWDAAAALVKPLVWRGQAWRLFTAVLLHGGVVHFYFNVTALVYLARLVEVHARRVYVPLVFLVSALGGSVASLLLMPNVPSVGASGGIMGITGFLVVLARRRRRVLPPGFLRGMLVNVTGVAVLGIFGIELIDNAAHAGGLVTGLALGALLVPTDDREPHIGWTPSPAIRAAGWLAMAALVAGAAATAAWIFLAGGAFRAST